MGAIKEVLVPDIGDFKSVDVIEILVKPGDRVEKESSLVTLESEKATMVIPSPAPGIVRELRVKIGDKVAEGSLILLLEEAVEGAAASHPGEIPPSASTAPPLPIAPPAAIAQAGSGKADATPVSPPTDVPLLVPRTGPVPYEPVAAAAAFKPHASPSVRKFAREMGVDLARVKGTGPKDRITAADVQGFVKGIVGAAPAAAPTEAPAVAAVLGLPEWPQVDFAKFGPIETKPRSRIKKLSGANLHRNWVMIPHVTQLDEADITDLETFRKSSSADTERQGFKLTMLAFLIKACVTALRQYPEFNASLDKTGENLVIKGYYHIGVAVDTPDGLVVPVIRDADRKGVFDLARELGEISKLARDKKLKPGDMQGGTFSISSLGGIGGTAFTPIINAPEVAILGVSRSAMRPVYRDGQFVPRLMLPLSLSYDHRVIDGALAARFTTYLASVLSDIRRILL